jgi:group I intron endonuclease
MKCIEIIENNMLNENNSRFIVYLLTNKINNKIYIGQTIQKLKERLRKYLYLNTQIINRAIHKYGCENFQCEVLCYANSIDDLNDKEIFFINKYNSTNKLIGYNIRKGGHNFEKSDETKQKISLLNIGKHLSDETKQKISLSTSGTNNHFYGKSHSVETKMKMSELWDKSKHITDKARKNMSKSQLGRKHPQKIKDKISKSHIGIRSHETPVILVDKEMNILMKFNNIPNCADFLKLCTRSIYSAVNKMSLVQHKYYIIKDKN